MRVGFEGCFLIDEVDALLHLVEQSGKFGDFDLSKGIAHLFVAEGTHNIGHIFGCYEGMLEIEQHAFVFLRRYFGREVFGIVARVFEESLANLFHLFDDFFLTLQNLGESVHHAFSFLVRHLIKAV